MSKPTTTSRSDSTYTSPQLVDAGAVEVRTQNNLDDIDYEDFEDNIIWGQLETAPGEEPE